MKQLDPQPFKVYSHSTSQEFVVHPHIKTRKTLCVKISQNLQRQLDASMTNNFLFHESSNCSDKYGIQTVTEMNRLSVSGVGQSQGPILL